MAQAYNLLVAGLGRKIDEFLIPVLEGQGYHVRTAVGRDELLGVAGCSFELVLVDLPSGDELPLLAELRGACAASLMVIGPARNDKLLVVALEQGADDYVQRPFRTDELLARIRAQLRRVRAAPALASFGGLRIDPQARQVSRDGQPLELSPHEYALLATLAAQPGFSHPAGFLLEQVWGRGSAAELGLLMSAVARLRGLIEDNPAAPRLLCGEPSVGYWLSAPVAARELSRP